MDTKAYLSFIFLPSPSLTSTHTFEKKPEAAECPACFPLQADSLRPIPERARERERRLQTLLYFKFFLAFLRRSSSGYLFSVAFLHFFHSLFYSFFRSCLPSSLHYFIHFSLFFFFYFSFLDYFISSEFISLLFWFPVRRSVGWSLVLFSFLNYQVFSHSIFPDFRVFTDVNGWHGSTPKLSRCITSVCKCKCRL